MTEARRGQIVHGMIQAYEALHRGFLDVLLRVNPGDPGACEKVASELARAHALAIASREAGEEIVRGR